MLRARLATAAVALPALVWLIFNTLPTVPNRWVFFLLLQVALTGSALPFVHYLHQRFDRPGSTPLGYIVLVRQSIWVGLFGVICMWLRIPRLLSIPLAVVVLGALTAYLVSLSTTQQRSSTFDLNGARAYQAARAVIDELRHLYLIAFEPGSDPGWHPIEIRTPQKDFVVRTRGGYVAGPAAR